MSDSNPWSGLSPYKDGDWRKFCGRDDASFDVARLIDNNIFVTLYGKSGIGKSSLLNAGVFPRLRASGYLPVSIRLGVESGEESLQSCILHKIDAALSGKGTVTTREVVPMPETEDAEIWLWSFFARNRFADNSGNVIFPVLVFDQFEEVFRSRPTDAASLLRQIYFMMDESHRLTNTEDYIYDFNYRFVVSIREDELYRMEDCIDGNYLSEMKKCRYRLRGLSEDSAKEVVMIPGESCLGSDKESVTESLIQIARNKEDGCISTNILSLVCSRAYNEMNKRGEKEISKDLVSEMISEDVFEKYYLEATAGFPKKARQFIEDHLVDSEGRRNSVSESDFMKAIPNGEALIADGPRKILQRVSAASGSGRTRIELVHDSFCLPIAKLKKQRNDRSKPWWEVVFFLPLFICACIWILGFQGHPFVAETINAGSILIILGAVLLLGAGEAIMRTNNRIVEYVLIIGLLTVLAITPFALANHWLSFVSMLSGVVYLVFRIETWNSSDYSKPDTAFGLSSAFCFFLSLTITLSLVYLVPKSASRFEILMISLLLMISILLLEAGIDRHFSRAFVKRLSHKRDGLLIFGCIIIFILVFFPKYTFVWLLWVIYFMIRHYGSSNYSVPREAFLGGIESLVIVLLVLVQTGGIAPWCYVNNDICKSFLYDDYVKPGSEKNHLVTETWIVSKEKGLDKYSVWSIRRDYDIFSPREDVFGFSFSDYQVKNMKSLPVAKVNAPVFWEGMKADNIGLPYVYDEPSSQICYFMGRRALAHSALRKAARFFSRSRDSLLIDLHFSFANALEALPDSSGFLNVIDHVNALDSVCNNEFGEVINRVDNLTDINHVYESLSLELGDVLLCHFVNQGQYAEAAFILNQMLMMCFGEFYYDNGIIINTTSTVQLDIFGKKRNEVYTLNNDFSRLQYGRNLEDYYKFFHSIALHITADSFNAAKRSWMLANADLAGYIDKISKGTGLDYYSALVGIANMSNLTFKDRFRPFYDERLVHIQETHMDKTFRGAMLCEQSSLLSHFHSLYMSLYEICPFLKNQTDVQDDLSTIKHRMDSLTLDVGIKEHDSLVKELQTVASSTVEKINRAIIEQ